MSSPSSPPTGDTLEPASAVGRAPRIETPGTWECGSKAVMRPSSPHSLLASQRLQLLKAIAGLPGAPWDVHRSQVIAGILGVSAQAFNDWRYRKAPEIPPHEDMQIYGTRSLYFRKDRLLRWAGSEGPLWRFGAEYVETELSFDAPCSLAETNRIVGWLLESGLIRLSVRCRKRPFIPYSDDDDDTI